MSVELKPCPFCGRTAHVMQLKSSVRPRYFVGCANEKERCIASSHWVFGKFYWDQDEAIEAWNRRTASVNFEAAEHDDGGCLGYSALNDDEPIDRCKYCEKYTGNRRTKDE